MSKRLVLILAFLFVELAAFGQHDAPTVPAERAAAPAEQKDLHGEAEIQHADQMTGWKWANFFILAGLLGWVIRKNARSFFASRNAAIQKGIAEATEMRRSAEARAAAVEVRLAALDTEIGSMRKEARAELQAEADRILAQTTQLLAKIQSQAEQDIAAAGKAARQELKAYSADLSIRLAEQKLRNRITADAQQHLVASFVNELEALGAEVH